MAVLFTSLVSCSVTQGEEISFSKADPIFNWFSYEGNDPVYENLEVSEDEYLNPILTGFYLDSSIASNGEDFYTVHSSFSYYPDIPIFHNRDLVNWKQV